MTDEYKINNSNLNIYKNSAGSVPYVDIVEFIEAIRGLISEDVLFTENSTDNEFTVSYTYTDEETNEDYELTLTADFVNNTITVPDTGFFYGYVEQTETNFSRNIFYNTASDLNHFTEEDGLVLDLGKYNMEVISYQGKALIPFYVANLIFANSNYYSVYYNQENLTGVYFIPNQNSPEAERMYETSQNGKEIPGDLLIHNFNFLAFFFDNFYGLKDYQQVDTYYHKLLKASNALLSNSAVSIDNGIFNFINKEMDEMHTYFESKSYYQNKQARGPKLSSIDQLGPSGLSYYNSGLFAVDRALEDKWGAPSDFQDWHANSPNRPPYWFIDDKIVVVTLDGFDTADIEERTSHDDEVIKKVLKSETDNLIPTISGTRLIYFNTSEKDEVDLLEILVKGNDASYVDTYTNSLIAAGFTKHGAPVSYEEPIFKAHQYFTKTVDSVEYMVQITYNEEFNLFYVGISSTSVQNYEDDWPFYPDFDVLIESDSAIYLEFYLEKAIKEKPTLTHGLVDLTFNMGGNVGALYRVIGMLFNKEFVVSSFDPTIGSQSSRVIDVKSPVNFGHLNWSLLTSKVSFSAGNMMPTIVKANKLGKIIGQTSGGGAASVTPVYLPIGTIFASSSSNVSAYVEGDNTEESPYIYIINEGGIEPDHILSLYNLYNNQEIAALLLGE